MLESESMRDVWRALSRGSRRVFRNNVGRGWAGGNRHRKAARVTPENLAAARASLRPGDVVIPLARPLHAGLQTGSADLIGWETVEIEVTAAMVSRLIRLAVFASVETKAPARGRAEPAQLNWLEQVRQAGGIAVIARTPEDAASQIEGEKSRLLGHLTKS